MLSVFLIAFGTFYATVQDFLWFHAAAVPSSALEAVRPLYLALMKLIGGSSAGLGLLGLYVTLFPLRRGSVLAAMAISVAYSVAVTMAAVVAEKLAAATGAPTSWRIMGVLMAIIVSALVSFLCGRTREFPRR